MDIFSLWLGIGVPKHFDPDPKWGATNTKNVYIKRQKVGNFTNFGAHALGEIGGEKNFWEKNKSEVSHWLVHVDVVDLSFYAILGFLSMS